MSQVVTREDLWALATSGAPLSEQRGQLRQGLLDRRFPLGVVDAVMAVACDGYVLWQTSEPTRSRVGGAEEVRLPTGMSWPVNCGDPLSLLYEICLDDLIGREGVSGPSSGFLMIFTDEDPSVEGSLREAVRVLHRAPNDRGILTTEGADYGLQPHGQVSLKGLALPTLPAGSNLSAALDPLFDDIDARIATAEALDSAYGDLITRPGKMHGLLNAPITSQGTLSEGIGWWFKEPEAEGELRYFSESEREGRGWRMLMQLVDLPGLDMTTAGDRYLMIPELDLAAGRFDRVITLTQS